MYDIAPQFNHLGNDLSDHMVHIFVLYFLVKYAVILLIVFAAISYWMIGLNLQVLLMTAAVVGVGGVIKVISDTLSEPLSQWVTKLFQEEDYGKQIGYMSLIRDDLAFLEKRLARADSRILVIIDDLDRCEPNKAVEVLRAIKLLLNFNSFIVCIGIDARIITRAIQQTSGNRQFEQESSQRRSMPVRSIPSDI